jgi:O-glycosyl hydrolase
MKKILLTSLLALVAVFANAANVTLTVNNTRYQYVKGFGAFVCSPQFTYNHMSESEIRQVWGPNSTLKCNIMRLYLPIGESSFSQSLSTARLGKNLGLYVFASPWSMPANWKTINSVNAKVNGNQNYLQEQYYGSYADYLNNYVTYLRNNGVNLDAISIQNEPDWPCEYAGCIFTTTQIVNFLANYANRINCKVIAPETIGMSDNYANALLNSSAALANFEIYGGHQYAGIGSAFKNLANKGKELWMTEYLINWTEGDNAQNRNVSWASDAFNFASAINNCMLNNVNAWVHYTAKRFYSIMGDGQRGTTSGQITKRGYILGNFSKYITGSTRLGSSFSSSDLSGSTYLSQTGDTIFAVIINSSGNSHNLTVSLPFYTKGGKMAVTTSSKNLQESNLSYSNATNRPSVTIEASSVTTLVFVSSSAAKVADFDYDLATGRYYADPNDLMVSGDLSFNPSTGEITLPAGKSGKLTLTFNNADFSNVSKIKMSREGDDIFNTLMIRNTAGNSVNTDGGPFYTSKYNLNYTNYQGNSASVSTLEWDGYNDGSATKTMTLRQILIQVDVMRADKKHEVSLDQYAFGIWDGIGANASKTGNDDDMEYNIDQCIAGYGTIYGNGNVKALNYVDLTRYSKLRVYGDNGVRIRALFNRPTDTSSDFVEMAGDITDGVFEVDLKSVGAYAHMNALKVGGGTGSAWRVMVVDDNDPMDYRISGKQYVASNLNAALSDLSATNYDATGLTNTAAVTLNTTNKNALIYVANASKLSNDANVVVKNGNSYTAANIVLLDGMSASQTDRPGAYFPNGTVKSGNATWADTGDGSYAFHWSANTQAEVQIFNYILERQDYNHLVVETTSFTKPWGIRFYDNNETLITQQGYWAGQHDGNRIKDIDIDSLFMANGVSNKRSTLTMVRLYNISDEEGEVVVKSAYLCNSAADCVYPFYAPYDIVASAAKLASAVTNDGFTTLCVPFNANVPSGFNAYGLTTEEATQTTTAQANKPIILKGAGNVEFNASNVTVKATDELEAGILKGVYSPTVVAAGNYVQKEAARADSFSPVEGVTLYVVTEGAEPTVYPFHAFATEPMEQQGGDDPDNPDNPDNPDDPTPDNYDPYQLTVTTAGVATLYLPFDAVIPNEDFFAAAAVVSVSGSTAYLKQIKGGIIPANTGVMIFANPGAYTINPSQTAPTEIVNSILHGVLVDTPIKTVKELENGANIYVLSRGIEEYTGFKIVGTSVKTIGAYRAYLAQPADSQVKEINISFGKDPATGIEEIKNMMNGSNVFYDLSGRRVVNPTKGIYILNGKKIYLR